MEATEFIKRVNGYSINWNNVYKRYTINHGTLTMYDCEYIDDAINHAKTMIKGLPLTIKA